MDHQSSEMPLEGTQHRLPAQPPSRIPTKDLCAEVRQRLQVLDAAEKAIAKERSEVAMAWNRTLPVNRLPNELLVSIFAHVQLETQIRLGSIMIHPDPVGPPHPSSKWMQLLLVCHYWRDVAYASPNLWRVIQVRSPPHTARVLALSSPATLDVLFVRHKFFAKNCGLLRPHAHRIRSLQFYVVEMFWKSFVLELLQGDGGPSPLETLQLPFFWRDALEEQTYASFVDLQLTAEHYPRLQSLIATHIVAPQDLGVYARLRKLVLRKSRCDFSFDYFLDALNGSANLEALILDSFLERIEGDWVTTAAVGRSPVPLQHLKSLEMLNHPSAHTSRFLSHILLSPTVSVDIDCEVKVPFEGEFTETVAAMLPSSPTTVLPGLALAKEVVVVVHGSDYFLLCSPQPHIRGKNLIGFRIESSVPEWNAFSAYGARDLLSVFASAPLTTLTFTGDCVHVPVATWTEIFSKYPQLETLKLVRAFTIGTVFIGLMDADPAPDSPVPCPSLQSVSIEAVFFEDALDMQFQCLRDRADKGNRLKHLSMALLGDEDDEVLMDTDYMPELKELVPDATCTFRPREQLYPRV